MLLTLTLALVSTQFAPTVPDDRQRALAAVESLSRMIEQRPPPRWAPGVVGLGLGVSALTFSLAVVLGPRAAGGAPVFLGLGVVLGIASLVGSIAGGFHGWSEAQRDARLKERREQLLAEYERVLATTAVAR